MNTLEKIEKKILALFYNREKITVSRVARELHISRELVYYYINKGRKK